MVGWTVLPISWTQVWHRHQQVAVGGGHDHGKDACKGQPRQAHRQHRNCKAGNHRVRGAEPGQNIVADDLVRNDAHEEHQSDGEAVDDGAQQHALFGSLSVSCGKGPLPHFRAGHGEHQIGDDVAGDAAVDVGLHQLRVQIHGEVRNAAHLDDGGDGDQNVHEQDQHIKLHDVRVDHAKQAGGGGVDDKHQRRRCSAILIAEAQFPASILIMVAVAVTWEATVPIMVNATITAKMSLAALPNRRSNRSGMEVTPCLRPISEIRPQ